MMRGFGPEWTRTFWCVHVAQIALSEKAVKHGIVALARLQEDYAHKIDITQSRNNKFLLTQYTKAITILRQKTTDIPTTQITLLTCVIFAHLELMRENPELSYTHLRSSLKIFSSYMKMYHSSTTIHSASQ